MMKQWFKTLLFALFLIPTIQAQNLEAGFFLGFSNYSGDLQPTHLVNTENKIAYGAFLKYQILDYLKVRATVHKGTISGSDLNSSITSGRRSRNLNFRSDIMDFGIQAEFHPRNLIDDEPKILSPYLVAGVNGFIFNPEAFYVDRWYDLAPIGTEGQFLEGSGVTPYKKLQISIPMGIGVDVRVSDYSKLGFEFCVRKTFTDYLDDVSGNYPDIDALVEVDPLAAALSYRKPEFSEEMNNVNPVGTKRGNPDNKDLYFFAGVNFSFNISKLMNLGSGPGNYTNF